MVAVKWFTYRGLNRCRLRRVPDLDLKKITLEMLKMLKNDYVNIRSTYQNNYDVMIGTYG